MQSYSLPKLPLTVSFMVAVCISGLGALCVGTWPAARFWTNFRKTTVFRAAPVSSTRTGPEKEKSVNWKFPPPYFSTGPLKTHRTHSVPSTLNAMTPPEMPKSLKCCVIGGTTGTAPAPTPIAPGGVIGALGAGAGVSGGGDDCAQIDAWLPAGTNDSVVATPSTNDANAIVVLDISPPSTGKSNCAVWHWHSSELVYSQTPL